MFDKGIRASWPSITQLLVQSFDHRYIFFAHITESDRYNPQQLHKAKEVKHTIMVFHLETQSKETIRTSLIHCMSVMKKRDACSGSGKKTVM